jgi:hypothetical protein
VPAKGNEKVRLYITPQSLKAADELRLGFIEASNPRKFRAMLQMATLNAARTMVKPVKAGAPVDTGRLRNAVSARKAKKNGPAAVVGIKAGRVRGDMKGAWYRWFVVSGTTGVRMTKRHGRVQVKAIHGRDFVKQAVTEPTNQSRAVDVMRNTIQAFLDGTIKYKKRKGR